MRASSRPDRLLLISDLHLEEARPELTQALLDFLAREAAVSSALYILGDLFNVWIGDDDDRPLNQLITLALRSFADAGLSIFLMHGNRDFLLGESFARACGATLLSDPHVLQHGDQRYLLMHGDLLCTRDTDYLAFRNLVRAPQWQHTFLSSTLTERRAFAAQARATSKSMNSNKADDIMDVTQSEVERQLQEHGVNTLIHGHTHRPAVHHFTSHGHQQQRFVLGDWGTRGWFVELSASGAALKQFDIPA